MTRRNASSRAVLVPVVCLLAACMLAGRPGMVSADEAGRARYYDAFLRYGTSGDADSARTLVHADGPQTRDVIEYLLGDRARLESAGQGDSARVLLATATGLARLYQEEFGDSLCIRLVAWHERRDPSALRATGDAWARFRECRQLYDAARWQEVETLLSELRGVARESGDPYLEAQVLRLHGNCYSSRGMLSEALAKYEEALDATRRIGDRIGEVRMLRNIASSYQGQDRLDEALVIIRQVLDLALAVGDRELHIGAQTDLGMNFWAQGELDSAVYYLQRSDSLALVHGNPDRRAAVLVNLGGVLNELGENDRALAAEEQAIAIARERGPRARRQELLGLLNAGGILVETGRYSRALACLREGIPIADEVGMMDAGAGMRLEIANIYALLGQEEDALRQFQESVPVLRDIGQWRHAITGEREIGNLLARSGRWEEARAAYESAHRSASRSQNKLVVGTTLADLGWYHNQRGETGSARTYLHQARAIADSMRNRLLQGVVELELARSAAIDGDLESAIALADRSLAYVGPFVGRRVMHEALYDKASYARKQGDLHAADSILAVAGRLVEGDRVRQEGEGIRIGFFADRKSVFVDRVSVLHEMASADTSGGSSGANILAAFETAERARARELLDLLAPGGMIGGGTPAIAVPGSALSNGTLDEQERRLTARLGILQTEMSKTVAEEQWDAGQVDSLERELAAAAASLRELTEEISARAPSFGALSGSRDPLALGDVQTRVLAPGQMLIEYLVGKQESFVFLVTHDRFRLVRIPAGEDEIARRVQAFRDGVAGNGPEAGESLHELIIGPIAAELATCKRLLIVPDGALFYLPFEALPHAGGFLVESCAVSYAPSASVLDPSLHATGRRPRSSILAVGNPHTYREEVLLTATDGGADPETATRVGDRWRWGALPYAGEEVDRIVPFFEEAVALTGMEATEEAVKTRASHASYLHFATHGLLDEGEPLLSGLALAQDQDPAEDGLLQAFEILRLPLVADLVVLSGCNTGLGAITDGEGVLGLTRAFMHAGARSMVISLWEVNDRSTAGLMEGFYRARFTDRKPADLALQEAKLAAVRAGLPAREWAPFCFVGAADIALPRRNLGPLALFAVVGVSVLAAIGIIATALTRRRA